MKSKYRKMIYKIFFLTLGIGTGMMSFIAPQSKYGAEKAALSNSVVDLSEVGKEGGDGDQLVSAEAIVTPTPSPTPSPTPTPIPVYPLEENDYPEAITALVDTFYKAKISCDIDTMKSISTNPEAVVDRDSLKMLVDGIEDCLNMKCYVKRTYQEDFYIVWVYYDIKFISLDTYAPSLAKLYIQRGTGGDFKVYDGELEATMKAYADARNKDQDVVDLIEHTEKLAKEAKKKDKKLRNYWELREQN